MSKASQYFFGSDSYGRSVETAQRETDGQWFSRCYEWNGYGKAWSKWTKDVAPSWINNDECEWGFKKLRRVTSFRIRLPA